MTNEGVLKWQFDVSTFRLLGRELITDRITALFELVKNSYDANAENVYVKFFNVGSKNTDNRIVIWDDGNGMSFEDIEEKWMVIGTNSKRIKTVTDPPYKRRVVGEKGLGRFAVDKLGAELILKTKKKESKKNLFLKINWNEYEKLYLSELNSNALKTKESNAIHFFTEIENKYWEEDEKSDFQGTELIIEGINEIWSEHDIERAYKELSKLVSPFENLYPPFNIFIYSNEHKGKYNNLQVKNQAVKYASLERLLDYETERGVQQVLNFNKDSGELDVIDSKIQTFGPVRFRLFYFDQGAKSRFKRAYRGSGGEILIDGIKIYRDKLITTPFAEYEAEQDKKRDILGIDKRRYSGFWDKVNSRDLIGIIEITKENNPKISDSSNRQDFDDNNEYRALKKFIIKQIEELEGYLDYKKKKEREKSSRDLKSAKNEVNLFIQEIKSIKQEAPQLSLYLAPIEEKAKRISRDISKGIVAQNKLVKDKKRQEDLFLSLMSLQDYAQEMAHIVRTSLEHILHLAEFFKEHFPDEKYVDIFKEYSVRIYDEIERLSKAVNFMLSYAKADVGFEEIDVKELIKNLFFNIYCDIFSKEKIKPIVEMKETLLISHNRKFLEDLFENLISNSIKAMKKCDEKIIKCSAVSYPEKFVIYFSDSGSGIDKDIKDKIFDVYYTTTAEEGGAGIGLFSVKKRIEALNGNIEVFESEYKPKGTTFKIVLPFKKNEEI